MRLPRKTKGISKIVTRVERERERERERICRFFKGNNCFSAFTIQA